MLDRYYFSAIDRYDNYIITLTDNLEIKKSFLGRLRKALDEDYIDEQTAEMMNSNKGIKEMRISAAWIRSVKGEDPDTTLIYPDFNRSSDSCSSTSIEEAWQNDKGWKVHKNPEHLISPLLYARISKSESGVGRLQYIFCVPIPKTVAIVSERIAMDKLSDDTRDLLYKNGWRIFSPEEFIDKSTDKSYEFILFDDNVTEDANSKYQKVRRYTSNRLLKLSEMSSLDIIDSLKNDKIDPSGTLSLLFKTISRYREGDRIAIMDKKTTAIYNSADSTSIPEGGVYYQIGNVSVSDGKKAELFIYRTHHESRSEFISFLKKSEPGNVFNGCKFVEGISGNNSTDRLVRNDKINDIWFYRHLHAMKTKVAIFDERIFSKVFGVTESDFYEMPIINNENLQAIKTEYCKQFFNDAFRIVLGINSPNDMRQYIREKGVEGVEKDAITSNYSGKAFAQKNVYIFNLIQSKTDSSIFNLMGLKSWELTSGENESFHCICGKIAELSNV